MSSFKLGPFEVGLWTAWLGTHGLLMLVVLAGLAFIVGALCFARQGDDKLVRGLGLAAALTFLALVALTVTGLVPDVVFEKGALFSGRFANAFGTVQATVTDDNVAAFTGPLLFDVMEHVALVVPGLGLLLWFWIVLHGRRVVEEPAARGTALALAGVTAFWLLAIGNVGLFVTKVLTIPCTR